MQFKDRNERTRQTQTLPCASPLESGRSTEHVHSTGLRLCVAALHRVPSEHLQVRVGTRGQVPDSPIEFGMGNRTQRVHTSRQSG